MIDREPVVLDASVGVKWLKNESGSDEARELLREHGTGAVRIVVPVIFVHEVIDVARRRYGPEKAEEFWRRLQGADITVVGIDGLMVEEMLEVCAKTSCTFYDAAAPALAARLGARFVSADRRAHSSIEGARLIA